MPGRQTQPKPGHLLGESTNHFDRSGDVPHDLDGEGKTQTSTNYPRVESPDNPKSAYGGGGEINELRGPTGRGATGYVHNEAPGGQSAKNSSAGRVRVVEAP